MQMSQYENIKANYKKGSFLRLTIQSPAKTLAAAKKAGYDIQKRTEITTRLGCKYSHLANTIESGGVVGIEDYAKRLDDFGLFANKKDGTLYLQFANIPQNANVKTKYTLNGKTVKKEDVEQYLQKSSKGGYTSTMRVKLDNIVSITNKKISKGGLV